MEHIVVVSDHINGHAEQGQAELTPDTPENAAPSHEDIARLAYSLWECRGSVQGCPDEDWYRAEQLLRLRIAAGVTDFPEFANS